MESLRAQIKSITLAEQEMSLVYQRFTTFQKDSIWAHCTDSKGCGMCRMKTYYNRLENKQERLNSKNNIKNILKNNDK